MDKKGRREWEEMQEQQRSMQDQLSSLSRKSDSMRQGLAQSAAGDVFKAGSGFVREFKSGGISKAFEKLVGCLVDLRGFDPDYLSTLSGKEPYGTALSDEQRFFVQYIFTEMGKGDCDLLEILGRIYAQRHVKINPFLGKEEK